MFSTKLHRGRDFVCWTKVFMKARDRRKFTNRNEPIEYCSRGKYCRLSLHYGSEMCVCVCGAPSLLLLSAFQAPTLYNIIRNNHHLIHFHNLHLHRHHHHHHLPHHHHHPHHFQKASLCRTCDVDIMLIFSNE